MIAVSVATIAALAQQPPAPAAQDPAPPNPDAHYQLGPDSLEREGVAKGEVKGPFTLPSQAYPGRSTLTGSTCRRSTART